MLSENLIMLRNAHKLSQEQVAETINISRQAYAKWEKGETIPDIEKCNKLAQMYNTTIDALVTTEKHENKVLLPAPKGKHVWGTVTVDKQGCIAIPKDARDAFNINAGATLVVLGEDNEGIALVPTELFEKKIKQMSLNAFEKAD